MTRDATPRRLDRTALRAFPLPHAAVGADKDGQGRVLAIAGALLAPGAALLCGVAALRAGAGKVQLVLPRDLAPAIGAAFPECGILSQPADRAGDPRPVATPALREGLDADAVLMGPGLAGEAAGEAWFLTCLRRGKGVLIADAAALHGLWRHRAAVARAQRALVITPHHGEMATLLGISKATVERAPLKAAAEAARGLGAVVALKAHATHVVAPDGRAWVYQSRAPGLATAGSGDVLAGLLAGLAARGAPALTAALWAVVLHGDAGRRAGRGDRGLLAREILDALRAPQHRR